MNTIYGYKIIESAIHGWQLYAFHVVTFYNHTITYWQLVQ